MLRKPTGDIDLSGDGEVTKKVLREGKGETVPTGALVAVHYVGRLTDGTIFDESYKRNTPLTVYVGKRMVIPGWDICLQSMRVGEICELRCSSTYGYGKQGIGPIPPNATLHFEIELLEVKEDSEKYSNILIYSVILMFVMVVLYLIFNRVYPLIPIK